VPDPAKLSAILLAAGESRRMGAANKLLLDIDGEPLVRRTALTLVRAGFTEIVAVLGHEYESVSLCLSDLPLRHTLNTDYREGQMSSVHAGLAALEKSTDGVMIVLGDQPLLTPDDIQVLADAFSDRGDKSIVVPTHEGIRGNPIVLATRQKDEIIAGAPNLGCRRLIERNPALVHSVEMDNDHFTRDIDTEEDFAALAVVE